MILRMTQPNLTAIIPNLKSRRPERATPRDEDGQIPCRYLECKNKSVRFRRACEFNKHMDRHERPYRCTNPVCDQTPGFTYSGGLLRHQREVHKMHLSREPLFCPFSNCVRSAGTGFTRKENLEEHLRRRHSGGDVATPSSDDVKTPELIPLQIDRKRMRYDSYEVGSDEKGGRNTEQIRSPMHDTSCQYEEIVGQLRMDVAQRDQIIARLEQELSHMQRLVASLPPVMYQPLQGPGHMG